MLPVTRHLGCAALLLLLAGCVQPATDNGRFLVFFDEFSANLTPEAHKVVADAVPALFDRRIRARWRWQFEVLRVVPRVDVDREVSER